MSQKQALRKYKRILESIVKHQEKLAEYSDEQLQNQTKLFKKRLARGESLESLLPEAFATVCEADYRVLGMQPYQSQIIGGIALHHGYLAEMYTGEGKTLVATMPLYLNALTEKSVILMTTNDYLALRDAEEMGKVYRFLGLTVAAGVQKKEEHFTNQEKKAIYAADIVYSTHGTVGFDYLFNNLVKDAEDRFMRPFYYVIIDEADSVLLDSASTPLVISASPRVQSNLYQMADFFVTTLEEGVDYEKEEKKVWLTEEGVERAESYFQIDNFYAEEYFEINRHVTLALKAHALFEKEKDYMVSRNGELYLLDRGSGRSMPGVKLRGGMHQAIEVKEGMDASQDNRSVAAITFQNFFRLFPKMAGMSGTIYDAKDELFRVYGSRVLRIPTNKPVIRKDLPDQYFTNATDQFSEAMDLVEKLYHKGQPVLVVVSGIRETNIISHILIEEKIPHSVLNANNAFWEADIIKQAGQKGAVTVATSMAGRGTDIKLGEGVRELGGLFVVGIGRLANIRLERQARGRAGRQGDPGSSQFFVSLEDEIVSQSDPKAVVKYVEEEKSISLQKLRHIINRGQRVEEERAVQSRQQAMDYDQIMSRQRELIYDTRDRLLDEDPFNEDVLLDISRKNIRVFLESTKRISKEEIIRYSLDNISYHLNSVTPKVAKSRHDKKMVEKYLVSRARKGYLEQRKKLGSDERMKVFMRKAALQAIDDAWIEQVDYLQQLQSAISGRTSAQRNLLSEYQSDALEAFQKMEKIILNQIMRNVLLSNVYTDEEGEIHMVLP